MKPTRLVVLLSVAGGIGVAVAQPDETAASAFKRGQAALKAGRVHEACAAFEASDKLAAAIATELALADCYEQDGKLVAAARVFRSAADKDTNAARRKKTLDKAAKLDSRAPKLHVVVIPRVDGVKIKVDGVEVAATGDVQVDLGPHEIIATAPDYEGKNLTAVDREGDVVEVSVHMERRAGIAPPEKPAPEPPPPVHAPVEQAPPSQPTTRPPPTTESKPPSDVSHASGHRRRNGAIIGLTGAVVLVGAAVLDGISIGKFHDEHALCPGYLCANNADTAKANSLRDDGRSLRAASIGMGIGGAAIFAVGAYLLATPGHREVPVAVRATAHGGDVSYTLRF